MNLGAVDHGRVEDRIENFDLRIEARRHTRNLPQNRSGERLWRIDHEKMRLQSMRQVCECADAPASRLARAALRRTTLVA